MKEEQNLLSSIKDYKKIQLMNTRRKRLKNKNYKKQLKFNNNFKNMIKIY